MKQLHPNYIKKHFTSVVIVLFFLFFLIGSIASVVLVVEANESKTIYLTVGILFIVFLALVLIAWIMTNLSHRFYRYELKEKGFYKESGIVWKTYVTIPYSRIQNIEIYRGLLDRLFGLSQLHIQTAGYSGPYRLTEGRLPGLSVEVADQLCDELANRSGRQSPSEGV